MSRYRALKSSVDLHLQDLVRNHDKVYHLAVFERNDGGYDVLYGYGRRGSSMRLGILKGGENLRDYQTAIRLMHKKETEQVQGDGYQYADGITPGVWNNLMPKPSAAPTAPATPQPKEPGPEATEPHIGGNGPKSWFW